MKPVNLIAAFLVLVASVATAAQTYPSRPMRIIGHAAPGGINDLVTRAITDKISASLGQSIVIENRPGAHGDIGIDYASRATPDGYTLLFAGISLFTLPALGNPRWDPTKDFAGVATVAYVPSFVVVPASVPVRSLQEFIDYTRARPDKINSLDGGTFGPQNLTTVFFKRAAGIEITPVGYKGLPLGVPDLLAGRLHFSIIPWVLVDPFIKAGKLRPLAVVARKRSKLAPELPTMAEAGFEDATVIGQYQIVVPKGTPRAIVTRWNDEVNKALADPGVLDRLDKIYAEPIPGSTVDGLDAQIGSEVLRWKKLAKEFNLKIH